MMTYIFLGIIFMFCIEYSLNIKKVKTLISNTEIGWAERIMGVFFWPLWLGIFLYNFFKTLFK